MPSRLAVLVGGLTPYTRITLFFSSGCKSRLGKRRSAE